ncbi:MULTISPECIES: FecR domain-containing protein [unclassified Pseudomonas]|uniref:FecR domain-containing protein n=1 Tax=unclassified Pseudomonas TaxID=196821 RepID=UPI0015A26F55|nr:MULTISPECIES: FecR domain-containing protein [unclassified Pseudomonas]NWC96656.1 FecR domain-containing protein [Pseudomonas sp. IPO3779]NWD19359.1 FecR domain-containing protein [Pseudomonas sp. IPO3778]
MSPSIDPLILGEAADWMVQLQSGSATDEDRRAIAQWQGRSAQHAQAWQRAQAILGDFNTVPAAIAGDTLKRIGRKKPLGRRQALGLLLAAGPAAWLAYRQVPWQQWTADQHTAIGEQKNLTLPDGTRVLINTGSSLNIAFSEQVRRIELLKGEVLITTAKDGAHRPFIVQTRHGTARALGTRFSVRVGEQRSRVAVTEGAVELLPEHASQGVIVKAGEQGAFSADGVAAVEPLDVSALTWENGMLLAQHMRLADLLEELGRYRAGVLRCHDSVANLTVSGAFSLRDTDASLHLLQETLPVKVSSLTGYWVTVEPR